MLNTTYFTLLAGNTTKWDQEILDAKAKDTGPGRNLRDPDFNLCEMQINQHRRGRRTAELGSTLYHGWVVRHSSNLADRATICGGRGATALTQDQAIEAGILWANKDPDNREFIARNRDLEGTITAVSGKEQNRG